MEVKHERLRWKFEGYRERNTEREIERKRVRRYIRV